MKTAQTRKWISIILFVALFLSGICLEDARAEFSFDHAVSGNAVCTIGVPAGSLTNRDICSDEQFGTRSQESIIEKTGRICAGYSLKTETFLSPLKFFQETISVVSKVEDLVVKNTVLSRSAIIRYIHNQDGSKG